MFIKSIPSKLSADKTGAIVLLFTISILYFMPCITIAKPDISKKSPHSNLANFKPKHIQEDSDNLKSLNDDFLNRDWVEQQRNYHACPGYYKNIKIPLVSQAEISSDSFELAKDGISLLQGNIEYLDNKQRIAAKKTYIKRNADINKVTELLALGNVEYINKDLRLISNELNINLLTNIATINSPTYFRYYARNARGRASKIQLIKDKIYNIYNSSFTTCPPNSSDWIIKADKISIDPNKQVGTAKNTTLYFYNIPIFYTPYLRFPTSNQRETGLLLPTYSSSSLYGYSIDFPYYFNLAPNYDLTLTPRYMTKRGAQFVSEARHLNKFGSNHLIIEYLPKDKEFETFRENNINNLPVGISIKDPRASNLRHANDSRLAVMYTDIRSWTRNLSSAVDYNYLSDNQYYIDLPRNSLLRQETEGHLRQSAQVNYRNHSWRALALIKGYQTLHTLTGPRLTEPYRIVPTFELRNPNIEIFSSADTNLTAPLMLAINAQATRFSSPPNPVASRLAEGQRYFFKPEFSLPFRKTYGYIIPKAAAHIRHYDLNTLSPNAQILRYNQTQTYFVPIFTIDNGLFFDKYISLYDLPLIHSLEPRVQYLYAAYKDQNKAPDFDIKNNTISYEQLFRDNDYSGYDRQSNANKVTTGLISRLHNAKDGQEYAKLQFGQAFFFEDKKVSICDQNINFNCQRTETPDYKTRYSPFISTLNVNLDSLLNTNQLLYAQAEWQWDYYLSSTKRVNLGLHYLHKQSTTSSPQTLFNIEYNFIKAGNIQTAINGNNMYNLNDKRNNLSEVESSVKLPLNSNLILLGFYSYDIRNATTLDGYLGIEFQNCCWGIRAGYRNQLRLRTNSMAPKKYDNIFTVQFSLKGLGEINKGFERVLRNNITGYQNQLDNIY